MTGPPEDPIPRQPDSLEESADPGAGLHGVPAHPIVEFTDADLAALLDRVARVTLVLGVVASLVLWPVLGWGTAALFAVGAAISVFSVSEWKRLVRLFNASMDRRQTLRGATTVVIFFLLRLILFGGAIYVSLKCFQGSPIALVCGLALAVAGLAWESLKLLRG